MIYPEIRNIHSPDLEPPNLPTDPYDCQVSFLATVGPHGAEGEETFSFTVITPAYLARLPEGRWGRGNLILPAFDWTAVVQSVATLLARCARATWADVAQELNKELVWEHDGSQPDA